MSWPLFLGRGLDDARVRREARSLRAALRGTASLGSLVGSERGMREVLDLASRVADAATPVLLVGETGTGKTALARAIHLAGSRAAAPFVAVNCAALPEALLESELFGHVKGAFHQSDRARGPGLFAEAHGGTLLLDEIGEMSNALQAKLLHVLESGSVRAVGANKEQRVDARILAATHRDLRQRARAGTFREDLLYRLDVVTIDIPALRHRREDIPLLVDHFLAQARVKHPRSQIERLAPDAIAKLLDHAWPGNVREPGHTPSNASSSWGAERKARRATCLPRLEPAYRRSCPRHWATASCPSAKCNDGMRPGCWSASAATRTRTAEALGVDAEDAREVARRTAGDSTEDAVQPSDSGARSGEAIADTALARFG